jgi:hypothetical protein
VAAQVDLDRGREPPQRPVAVGAGVREGGLREVELGRHALHPRVLGPGLEHADAGRVARERLLGERVDDPDPH